MKIKIVTVLGARPQFIKAATLSRAILTHPEIEEVIIHTGQHYDENMSQVFFDEMQIPRPKYQLEVGGRSHAKMTATMMIELEPILKAEKPDWVILYGDTNSTLAGALTASKLNIKIAHIEAGLRSYNNSMPEEINRILTDRLSTLLLCPTDVAIHNLNKEGYESIDCRVLKVGDIMHEGALYYSEIAKLPAGFDNTTPYSLVTIHRAENTDNPSHLKSIFKGLNQIGENDRLVMPLHPRTKKQLNALKVPVDNIEIINPIGYLEMISLIKSSKTILTDSGGLQKEAFFFKKPCITLREETEWKELLEGRFNVLAGHDYNKIVDFFYRYDFSSSYDLPLYGDTKVTEKIIDAIKYYKE